MPVRIALDIGASPAQVRAALLGLAAISLAQMGETPLPRLYSSGIRYYREPGTRERWQTARETYQRKGGDCEDLVAYRLAELHYLGERGATAVMRVINSGLMHCLIRRANGQIEDPSAKLGMKGKG